MTFYGLRNENKLFKSKQGEISNFTYEEKKSKFICYIFSIKSKEEAVIRVNEIRKTNFGARHVVYLYRVKANENEELKFSDDGEPQGTGTKSILEMVKKECITNICVVIVRYFGGVLLGTGPLTRAYLNSFKGAYDLLKKEEIIEYKTVAIIISYDRLRGFEHKINDYIKTKDVIVLDKIYGDFVKLELNVSIDKFDQIMKVLEEFI